MTNRRETMKEYFGMISIEKIDNKQVQPAVASEGGTGFIKMDSSNIRFVHYPDCQQLIIWLTHPGREYGNARLKNRNNNRLLEENPVAEQLNGSIQMIWNTVTLPPGSYIIEIDWRGGWQHQVAIEKLKQRIAPITDRSDAPDQKLEKENTRDPVEYRDGFGKIIKNEETGLRDKLIKDSTQRFLRHIEYEGNVRAGTIIYYERETRIEFYYEMGGGNCLFYIDIPTEKQWEARTQTPLTARMEILEYVATTVRARQAPACSYQIKNDTIDFYYK